MSDTCLACQKATPSPETTQGKFCSEECERNWAVECVRHMNPDECLDLMARIQSMVGAYTAEQVHEQSRTFLENMKALAQKAGL